MATTYAALVSLMKLLTRIQHPTCPASFERLLIQPLFDKVSFLVDFLEKFSQRGNKDLEALEIKMVEAVYAVEDIIEFYVVARTNPGSGESNIDVHPNIARYSGDEDKVCALMYQDLEKVIWEVDFIIQEAKKVEERNDEKDQLPRSFVPIDSSIPSIGEIKMVGFEEHLMQLMKQLYTNELRRETLAVVGMGGIGKSTLARNVYNRPYSKCQFDVRAWVTISQQHNVETIFCSLLKNIGIGETGQLGDQLYRNLVGKKYLIVLDDIWSTVAWDEINRFFPDNKNGSRILLTTRLMDVALSVGSCRPYELTFLDDDKSWNLLRETVFEQDVCPSELEKCGEKIAKSCKGLPLAIVVVGGLLKMSHKTLEYWQHVAENVNTLVNAEKDGNCMKILSLSYHQLPIHLKPCFLYLATFPEDCSIIVSRLLMLWVADGFLKPNIDEVLDEVALKYLNDLVSRNLIIVQAHNSMGRVKLIIMHDLVRDFCVSEAQKERFLHVRKEVGHALNESSEAIESHRRIVTLVSGPQHHSRVAPTRSARSWIWVSDWDLPPWDLWLSSVRVFLSHRKYSFINIAQLVNSRFLFFRIAHPEQKILYYTIPSPWNLETLIVHDARYGCTLPWEIWELPHLRHLIFRDEVFFPEYHGHAQTDYVLNNLQTLKSVGNFCFSDEVVNRIPNIKKLGVFYCHGMGVKHSPCFGNVVNCKKLEKLTCTFRSEGRHDERLVDELKTLKLTTNLRKLRLCYSRIPWDNMSIVSSLPNLEVLKLKNFAFTGEKWNSVEGEFPRLKVLSIRDSELVTWTAEDCCLFPVLERLYLDSMINLQEIPVVLGEVASLKSIQLENCCASVIKSAKQILEKQQQEQGTNDLIIDAYYICKSGDKNEELENLANDNFQIRFR